MTALFISTIAVFLWAGFIGAISFMESWLKFRAPGLTMPVGLSVGKLVFTALNRMEWLFFVVIVTGILFSGNNFFSFNTLGFLMAVMVLFVQTIWLLPSLNKRAAAMIQGKPLSRSGLHWYFVFGEFVKLSALLLFGISLLGSLVR